MVTLSSLFLRSVMSASALVLLVAGNAAWADPPGRVARMSFIRGEVGFQPGGSGEWADAVINRPLVTGDRLSTDRDARVELEIGAGSIRLDERTTFSLLNLDDRITQVELTDGTLNLSVRRLLDGQTYEIDTPTLAFVVSEPGEYRVDVAPNGDSTIVTVFDGSGDVYGENNASYRVRDGSSYRFNDSRLRDYEVLNIPRADDFDRFCQERTQRYERAVSSRYVSDELVGYADLDEYGSWNTVASYGSVWYPSGLRSDWAPYRDGHWAWIDPWGWSWIDDQPWGFAPSHYGRWANINNRWGWVPGPRHVRPVYAPALVAFVGGSNWSVSIGSNPVGWFPLGPRDVYRPWYDCSRDYFTRVNTRNTIITNITVVNVYNDYSRGRPSRADYAYRGDQRAFTAVPGNVFAGAKPVGRSRLRLSEDVINRGDVVNAVAVAPVQASLAARGDGRIHRPDPERFDRAVIARSAPPAQALPFAQREAIIRDNGNRSPGMEKLRARDSVATKKADRRVQVVDANAKAVAQDIPAGRAGAMNRGDATVKARAESADQNDVREQRKLLRENLDSRVSQDVATSKARAESAGQNDAREQRKLLRENSDSRASQDKVERMPSTRYSPAMRDRKNVDTDTTDVEQRRELLRGDSQERSGRANVDEGVDRNARQTQAIEQRRQAIDQQANAREQQRQEQMQAREERTRFKTPDAVDQPDRSRGETQTARQQRERDVNADAQRGIEMPRRNAAQEQRRAQAVEQRAQQADRLQVEQSRADQSNGYEAQQMQRDQMQQDRQSRVQEQQAQVQERQQQIQQRQAQQQMQMQQRQQESQQRQVQQQDQTMRQQQVQQAQMQRQQQKQQEQQQQAQQMQMQRQQQVQQQQQQNQQPQPSPQQTRREQRKQQQRDAGEAKEDQQNR